MVATLPRDLRDEYGPDVIQLALDRRIHSAEPAWRLWPSLAGDTARVIARTRLERLMIPYRALTFGLGLAIAAFAALSGDPIIAVLIAGLVGAGVIITRRPRRIPRSDVAHGSDAPSRWRLWMILGAVVVASSLGVVALLGDHELSAVAWSSLMAALLAGLTSLGTGLVILVQRSAP